MLAGGRGTRVLRVALSVADLANTRFAVSPLWEVVASVLVAKLPQQYPAHLPWSRQVLPRLARIDWGLLADLVPVPTVVIPAFVCPPPATSWPTLDLELAALTATPPDAVRACLDRDPVPRTPALAALYDDPEAGLVRLAGEVRAYADVALGPYWPRMRTLLEREVLLGARRMAEDGVSGLLNDLARHVSWVDDTLLVDHVTRSGSVRLDGRGVLLMPSVFTWRRPFSNLTEPSRQPTLRYPASAVATLFERGTSTPGAALGRVLGRTRATLLHELAVPSSTTELARRCGLAPATVSQHLAALRDAGLVGTHRAGRFLLYARTTAAEGLLAGTR
ncbi:ArsR/SmtB family transcription factor [Micromonospora sp. NPDC000089]|uniref:ArsR/SmtB family transcription factor n=1 Tax=unclassified Micromonospora TaxID=2617518 RepID=UPI0036CFB56A